MDENQTHEDGTVPPPPNPLSVPRNPLEILPLEIWTMILEMVQDKPEAPEDLISVQSCSEVCQDFGKILLETRTTWLFPKVLPILEAYISRPDILRLRQVCKSWNLSITTFLVETHPLHTPHSRNVPFDLMQDTCEYPPVRMIKLSSVERIASFQQFSKGKNIFRGDPSLFLTRSIWLKMENRGGGNADNSDDDDSDEDEDEDLHYGSPTNRYWLTVEFVLLQNCGSHIWHLTLTPEEFSINSDNYPLDFVRLLQRLLRYCLNLRSLTLIGWIAVTSHEDQSGPIGAREALTQQPLPQLPHLETLRLSGIQNLPPCISKHLIERHCENLKRLELNIPRGDWEAGFRLSPEEPLMRLPNLVDLRLDVDSMLVLCGLLENLKGSKVTRFYLNFENYLDCTSGRELLFGAVGHFRETLEVLVLHFLVHFESPEFFRCPSSCQTITMFQRNVPLLRYLRMDCHVTLPVRQGSDDTEITTPHLFYLRSGYFWRAMRRLKRIVCVVQFDCTFKHYRASYDREAFEQLEKQCSRYDLYNRLQDVHDDGGHHSQAHHSRHPQQQIVNERKV